MPQVSQRHIDQLQPYLLGESAKSNGEWDMYCPLHDDSKRSASLNIHSGAWFCQAGCGGGGVLDLIRAKSRWVPRSAVYNGGFPKPSPENGEPAEVVTMGNIEGWHSYLMSTEEVLSDIVVRKGIEPETLARFKIGYDQARRCYTIPVFGFEGEIWNVRRYDLDAPSHRRKIWSVRGMRAVELYPVEMLKNDELVIGEGEWDILRTIQEGYPAITRTAGANKWDTRWNEHFAGKVVYPAHDCDDEGQSANRRVSRALQDTAEVRPIRLPFDLRKKHGEDLSDFWNRYSRPDFERLKADAQPWKVVDVTEPAILTVLDSFDSERVGQPMKLQVTIKGKKDPGYSVPSKVSLSCTQDRGAQCQYCPLNGKSGEDVVEIPPTDPLILSLIDANAKQMESEIVTSYGVPGGKCPKLVVEIQQHQAVEVLFARPSIDHSDGTQARDYKNLKITSVGRHDTMPNNTVVVTGSLHPNPRDQKNEFLAWDVMRQETSVDRFEITAEAIKLMHRFRPRRGQRPLQKLGQINRSLASHVTQIVGRPEMHAVMDLTFHSVLSWKFGGKVVHRGWLESLILGDTRTGKSDAAEALVRHYGAGEIVGGEAASLAGLVGGVQRLAGDQWVITWGVVPINDRRIVVIDELSGLQPEDIAKMSDVRASGMARITKVQQEVTFARTRLLWLGNPRNTSTGMDDFTYGVDAIRPLIGNPEDIARFDLAMAVARGDVPPEDYNKRIEAGTLLYTSEACHTLLMWVWTRQPDQILWGRGAEDAVYKNALATGARYIEDPPLMQAANARIKIARVAIALAARTFSTDKEYECIVVNKDHVRDATAFINRIYDMPALGYGERSRERLLDIDEAEANRDAIRRYLLENRGLAKFLRSNSRFRRQDIEEVLNRDRDGANAIISKLWGSKMVRKEGADVRVEPTLHTLLREVRW